MGHWVNRLVIIIHKQIISMNKSYPWTKWTMTEKIQPKINKLFTKQTSLMNTSKKTRWMYNISWYFYGAFASFKHSCTDATFLRFLFLCYMGFWTTWARCMHIWMDEIQSHGYFVHILLYLVFHWDGLADWL